MNTESIQTQRVNSGDMVAAGDFSFDEDFTHLYIILPGEKHPEAIPILRGGASGSRVWAWDGNEEKPTINPSIHLVGCWHGYLRAGKLESC
jgi:hypothetical protein